MTFLSHNRSFAITFTITFLFWAARDPTSYVYSEVILKELRVKTSRQRIDFGATFVIPRFKPCTIIMFWFYFNLCLNSSLSKCIYTKWDAFHDQDKEGGGEKRQEANQCVPKQVPTQCIQFKTINRMQLFWLLQSNFQCWYKKCGTTFIIQTFTKNEVLGLWFHFFVTFQCIFWQCSFSCMFGSDFRS